MICTCCRQKNLCGRSQEHSSCTLKSNNSNGKKFWQNLVWRCLKLPKSWLNVSNLQNMKNLLLHLVNVSLKSFLIKALQKKYSLSFIVHLTSPVFFFTAWRVPSRVETNKRVSGTISVPCYKAKYWKRYEHLYSLDSVAPASTPLTDTQTQVIEDPKTAHHQKLACQPHQHKFKVKIIPNIQYCIQFWDFKTLSDYLIFSDIFKDQRLLGFLLRVQISKTFWDFWRF